MSKVGMGVMLGQLFGSKDTVALLKEAEGKIIIRVLLKNDHLYFRFLDGTGISISDEGQSCCENRYMTTDDALSYFTGATFISAEVRDAPPIEDEDEEEHDVQFLLITTNKGVITVETHNEHNGYYGGFDIECREYNLRDWRE